MVKLGWGNEGDEPLRAQIEEIRFNNMGTYAAKLEIHPNICGGMQEVSFLRRIMRSLLVPEGFQCRQIKGREVLSQKSSIRQSWD